MRRSNHLSFQSSNNHVQDGCTSQFVWLDHPPGAGGASSRSEQGEAKHYDPFVIPYGAEAANETFEYAVISTCCLLSGSNFKNRVLWKSAIHYFCDDQGPNPMAPQVDAGRGVLCRRRKMRPLAHLCISPVTGLNDRKRLVQQLTQNRHVQSCPANVFIGFLSGSTGPNSLARVSVSNQVTVLT